MVSPGAAARRRRGRVPGLPKAAGGAGVLPLLPGRPSASCRRTFPSSTPSRGAWSHLKRSLANLTKHSLDQLATSVKTRLKRMQYRPRLLEGLIAKSGLDIQLP